MSTEDFKAAVKAGNLCRAVSIAQEIMKSNRFDVAVIGEAGAGASSFINAIRDLEDYDIGAAKIALVGNRTNRWPTSYTHPKYPNLYLWDMPAISYLHFKADKYFEQVAFGLYDLFIIIASERFMYIHIELVKEIQRRGKSFYFVRSKVDDVLYEMDKERLLQSGWRKNFYSLRSIVDNDVFAEMDEESALQRIREECTEHLKIGGLTDHQVFLISSWIPFWYDFPLLKETLFNKIFSHEREKLLAISRSTLQEKKAEKWVDTVGTSILAGGFSLIAFLRPFDYTDALVMTNFIKGYYKEFGLDGASLSTFAGQVGKDIKDLKAVMTCQQASEITTNNISDLLSDLSSWDTKVGRCIPVYGTGVCMARTYRMLQHFLDDLALNTYRVLSEALNGEGKKSK